MDGITRRDFLAYTGSVLAGLSIGSCKSHEIIYKGGIIEEGEITEANLILRDFPETIPGAAEVRKYETPDAEYCLVHIRDMHSRDNSDEETKQRVREVQDDIYSILSFLRDKLSVYSVYGEGIIPEAEELHKYGGLLDAIESHPDLREELGALGRVYMDRKMVIRSSATYIAEMVGREEEELKASGRGILDNREDIALFMLADEDYFYYIPNPLKILVFGGGHAFGGKVSCGKDYPMESRTSFKDNIAWWNEWHRDKYSLIEIVPNGFKKYYIDGE
jgi:hypothetical protein